jgi:hypothetical protein
MAENNSNKVMILLVILVVVLSVTFTWKAYESNTVKPVNNNVQGTSANTGTPFKTSDSGTSNVAIEIQQQIKEGA